MDSVPYYGRVVVIFGPLAHLVERTHGMGEVSGSSPLWSTTGDVRNSVARKSWCSIVI